MKDFQPLLDLGYQVWRGNPDRAEEMRNIVAAGLVAGLNDGFMRIQQDLSSSLRYYPRKFAEEQLDRFRDLLGPDILIQRYPYLRIARPHKPEDNIGFHRDTLYGSSPHELSILIAITDLVGGAAFHVLPGSHLHPESAYPYVTGEPQCEKGSLRHQLGFLYAPKVFSEEVKAQMKPVELVAGDMLIFFPSIIHGQEVNSSSSVRLSMDFRLCNAFAPVNKGRAVHADYYEPLCSGIITKVAEAYGA